jgi:hypothetical protein
MAADEFSYDHPQLMYPLLVSLSKSTTNVSLNIVQLLSGGLLGQKAVVMPAITRLN